ncbi:STAS domain-containing protein [Methylobacterium phyllosphaerae]
MADARRHGSAAHRRREPLALLPRPLAGGALIAIGIGLLFNLNVACRTLPGWEIAIALIVCAATAFFGATTGFLVGVLLAILIFGVQYGQIGAIRRSLSGTDRRSSVIRGPDAAARLAAAGGRTRIYTLQGYLFFLNAQAIHRRAAAETGDLRVLILDFRETVGLDSSALIAFRKVGQLAEQRGFDVLLVHLEPAARLQITRSGLTADPRFRIRDTLDEALREAESLLLAEAGGAGPGRSPASPGTWPIGWAARSGRRISPRISPSANSRRGRR